MLDFDRARATMVDRQIRTADVTDRRVLAAFGDVPRELFVPARLRALAYSDADLSLGAGSSRAAPRRMIDPATLGRLIQLAEIAEGDIVLDVGCATGYASAVVSRLANSVVALEPDPDLAAAATTTLIDLDIGNVAVVVGALETGYPDEAPYDVIILGGSIEDVPEALTDQMKDGGRLVAVVGRGPAGMATLFRRSGGDVSRRPTFSAPAPPLPGFVRARAFAF